MGINGTFQDPISPIMYGISSLHDHILFFLALILFVVIFIFVTTVYGFWYEQGYDHKLDNWMNFQGISWWWSTIDYLEASVFDGRENKNNFEFQWSNLNNGTLVEIIWTVIPSVILLLIAIPSFALLFAIDEITLGKVIVNVIGHQWYWSYEVAGLTNVPFSVASFDSYMLPDSDLISGDLRLLNTDNALILPNNMPILALITSDDVLHSWAIPSFGVNVDAVPGRLSQISLLLNNNGMFYGQCSELCGVNHGFMPIEVWVVDSNTYVSLEMFLKKLMHM